LSSWTGAIHVSPETGGLGWFERYVTKVDGPAVRREVEAHGSRREGDGRLNARAAAKCEKRMGAALDR